jgi:DNA repair exonuclease SbcCD nuclease subunit
MKLVALGDLHISLRSNESFEIKRLEALSIELNICKEDTLVLVGDTFDRNRPNLQEIDLFYKFIHSLKFKNIWIISGNHDQTVFNYLPKTNFQYFDKPMVYGNMIFVGHNSLERFMNDGIYKDTSSIIFTHARCTIPPFITEEVSFSQLSNKYDLVILGDIHSPCDVQKNVYYTYEPNNNSFVKYKEKTKGYLVIDTTTLEVIRIFPKLPYKDVLKFDTVEGLEDIIANLPRDNLYKITLEIPLADIPKVNTAWYHVVYDIVPQINIVQQEEEAELKELVNRKVSIEDTLLQHTMTSYKFNIDTMNSVKNKILRSK